MTSSRCLTLISILLLIASICVAPALCGEIEYWVESETVGETDFVTVDDSVLIDKEENIASIENTTLHPNGYIPIPGFNAPSIHEVDSVDDSMYDTTLLLKASSLPAAYDLRDYGYVTSVKDQGEFGTCWAFSAIASLESNAVKKGYESLSTADFSELQLAYFMYNRQGVTAGTALPELSGLEGDDIQAIGYRHYLDTGGNKYNAMLQLASGIGITRESDVPYSKASYDLQLPPEDAVLKNAYLLSNGYVVSPKDRNEIKQLIMENGAGVISYYSGYYEYLSEYKGKPVRTYYQTDVTDTSNHAVALVGWDDSFPKENFLDQPKHDGAWLIKNSWGYSSSDLFFDDGYLWISYDEPSLNSQSVIFYDIRPEYTTDNIYQYDGSIGMWRSVYDSRYAKNGVISVTVANNFVAKGDEEITDISFVTLNPNVSYEVAVLRSDGSVATKESGTVTYCGYHTIHLAKPVSVRPNEKFTASVTYSVSQTTVDMYGDSYLSIPVDASSDDSWVKMISASKPGQGYEVVNGNKEDGVMFNNGLGGNYRVKAFSQNKRIVCYPFVSNAFDSGTVLTNLTDSSSTVTVNEAGQVAEIIFGEYRIQGDRERKVYRFIQPDAKITLTDSSGKKSDNKTIVTKSSALTFQTTPAIAEYAPDSLLFTTPTGVKTTVFGTTESKNNLKNNVFRVDNLAKAGVIAGVWSVQAVYNESILQGMPKEYLVGETVHQFTVTPSVSENSEPEVSELAFDTMDAKTPAIVFMDVSRAKAPTVKAPSVTRNGYTIVVNESVDAIKWVKGVPSKISVTLNPDNTLNLAGTIISDADALTIGFEGRKKGDVNGDGNAGIIDAVMTLKVSSRILSLDDKGLIYGDVTGDGKTNLMDAVRILQYSTRMTDDSYNLI